MRMKVREIKKEREIVRAMIEDMSERGWWESRRRRWLKGKVERSLC